MTYSHTDLYTLQTDAAQPALSPTAGIVDMSRVQRLLPIWIAQLWAVVRAAAVPRGAVKRLAILRRLL